MLTAIAHDHDFGIDTALVPRTPVWIHARHGSDLRGRSDAQEKRREKEGGGDKRREKRRGKGTVERKRGRIRAP